MSDFGGYPVAERTEEGVKEISIDTIFSILSVRLNPERVMLIKILKHVSYFHLA